MRMHACIHMHTCLHTRLHTYRQKYMHAWNHAYSNIHTYIPTHLRTYIHRHTYTYMHTYTHIRTYIHVDTHYTYMCVEQRRKHEQQRLPRGMVSESEGLPCCSLICKTAFEAPMLLSVCKGIGNMAYRLCHRFVYDIHTSSYICTYKTEYVYSHMLSLFASSMRLTNHHDMCFRIALSEISTTTPPGKQRRECHSQASPEDQPRAEGQEEPGMSDQLDRGSRLGLGV